MSHHHKKVIESIFAHPVSANIDFKEMEHAVEALGVDVEQKADNKVALHKDGKTLIIHKPHHHNMPKDEVSNVRKFLEECELSAETLS